MGNTVIHTKGMRWLVGHASAASPLEKLPTSSSASHDAGLGRPSFAACSVRAGATAVPTLFRRQMSDAGGMAVPHLATPVAGADAEGPLAGALALPLYCGAPGPVVIDPLTAAGMPFELGISFPPAVVRATPALPLVPSVPAVRSSVCVHPATSIKVHAINTPLRTGKMGSFMMGSRLVGPGIAIQIEQAQIDEIGMRGVRTEKANAAVTARRKSCIAKQLHACSKQWGRRQMCAAQSGSVCAESHTEHHQFARRILHRGRSAGTQVQRIRTTRSELGKR